MNHQAATLIHIRTLCARQSVLIKFQPERPVRFQAVPTRAALWLHGHTHASSDYTVGGTRVVANPAGYPLASGLRENSQFNPGLVLEVS